MLSNGLSDHFDALRKGGDDAIDLLVDIALALNEQGAFEHVSKWISIAVPALPAADRPQALDRLLQALLCGEDISEDHPTFH
jgi:hypothetical protein